MSKKKKFSRKLVLFVFSISFLLIIGSFGYFYYSGQKYISNSAIEELTNHFGSFNRASITQIEEYNNEVDGSLFNLKLENNESKSRLSNFLKINRGVIDEIYIHDKLKNKATLILPILVFSGELVVNFNPYDVNQLNKLFSKLHKNIQLNEITSFGYSFIDSRINYFLIKEYGDFSLILKFDRNNLFNKVTERINYPENIEFHLVSDKNVIDFSTNKFWVNQSVNIFLNEEKLYQNYNKDSDSEIIYGKWNSEIFSCTIIITNQISKYLNEFITISYKLLLYSIIVFLIIVIATLVYTNKISKSLNEISKVSISVGQGKFNNKINIKRDDELGLLIDSFNKMVDSLSYSYQQLNLTNRKLEEKIEELVKTKTELTKQQKLALIGETISKISHEIQNKISGISVWVQNLEMQAKLDENALMFVDEIKKSLNSFIEMLLNFKKFYRKPYLQKSRFNFNLMLTKILELYCADINAKKIEVKNSLPKEATVYGDQALLEEVIINLVVNAIYFSPENGKITLTTQIEQSNLMFSISNEGKTIPNEDIDNIFNPFFTTKSSGSGLGLAISKNVTESHDGQINVENLEPEGVKFTITIPINLE